MLFRRIGSAAAVAVASTAAVVAFAGTATAAYAPTTAIQVAELKGSDAVGAPAVGTSIGACNFLISGPSTNPNETPFRIEGQATGASTRPVASVELSCQLRTAGGSVLGTLTRNTPGAASAVAGDIPVRVQGPFQICTMVNIHFMDGGESNDDEVYVCQPLHGILG